jgi:trehalose 6-phosphate phosphatase
LGEARAALLGFAEERPGLLVEEKPASIALHYRGAPQHEETALALVGALAARTGLALQPGKMVVELRPPGADKGDAVRRLMAEPAFAGKRPVFVGDDLTDEHAFTAAAEMGGAGILVGPPRETAAAWRLDDVAAVAAWLTAAAGGADG